MPMENEQCLFTTKDLYVLQHDTSGRNRVFDNVSQQKRQKTFIENMHLAGDFEYTREHGIPQLSAFTDCTDFTVVAYSERNASEATGEGQAIHFFQDDYRFRYAVWDRLEETTFNIRKFDYYFTPDLSMWRNSPTEFFNIQSLFRTRFVGAYWQKCGYSVIPTVSWGGYDSMSYCFEGLPCESVVAVSGTGVKRSQESYRLWCHGLYRLEEEKRPLTIIVYGEEEDVPDLHTPVKCIPTYISEHFRKGGGDGR